MRFPLLITFCICLSLLAGCNPTATPTRIPSAKLTITADTSADRTARSRLDGEETSGSVAHPTPVSPNTDLEPRPASGSDLGTQELETSQASPDGTTTALPADSSIAATTYEPKSVEQDLDEPIPAERILLLTDSGPLLVDLHLTIDGIPYKENFQQVVHDIMRIADDDGDQIVTWDQLLGHPRFRQGQFGNPASTTYQAAQDMIRQYDTTKNDRVDPDELVRYLTSGTSSRSFSLYTSNYRRTLNRDASPIRRWLDKNDDLTLDSDEIRLATQRLRLRDANDDDVLLVSEFSESNAGQTNMMARRRPGDTQYLPKVGWQLDENQLWSDLQVAWNDFFALGQPVQQSDLGITAPVFERLDLDGDASLDNIEMEMLREVDADLSVNVELATDSKQNSATIELAALRLPQDSIYSIIQQPNRITIKLERTTIDLFAKDLSGYRAYDQQAKNFLQQGDADQNSYLDNDEFGRVAQFLNGADFESIDLDADGKVTSDEIVMSLEQRNIVTRNQVSVRADDQDDALFPTIDLNSDGRIDSREMAEASATLLTLDRNGDGEIALHELQGSMMIGVVRGGNRGTIMQGDTTFQVPQAVRKPSEAAPRWFTAMDSNRDQGISWREFLGTRAQFDELDTNQDGFLVLDEATNH